MNNTAIQDTLNPYLGFDEPIDALILGARAGIGMCDRLSILIDNLGLNSALLPIKVWIRS